ncbi:leucyl aminopeptidase family protein [Dichotomicrobium thermohalophilum]|uniref:Leucyl aminopeptidase n=1 Tax=Dichotomicrobium thermohalophilum TaxID=933063 RepID=A0A397Q4L7_9HYPH|nr:leucyl aminopeptidase family protein [Dichotomicrobium thermohalophilum]RIA56276.1 leucyl aminopeptidase [Dichotomicrobium thermohalophilum]
MTVSLRDFRDELGGLILEPGAAEDAIPVWPTSDNADKIDLPGLPERAKAWLRTIDWKARGGNTALLPGEERLDGAVVGLGREENAPFRALTPGILPTTVPAGTYRFAAPPPNPELAAVAWALGAYEFTAFRTTAEAKRAPRRLVLPEGVDRERVLNIASAVWLGRELINYPANELGPGELESTARGLANEFGADIHVIEGSRLEAENFPMIYAVGRASDRAPRLIDLTWGDKSAPKVTIVGKGICFDTGGLNIKPASAMGLMKKDMGGAASALSLAAMIMMANLPVRLRLLIPAADNNISASAFRPGDILRARNGTTVEIANTDAEGRLVLADALALADEEKPDHLLTFATLTGAARVALGADLPPFYTDDEALARDLHETAMAVADPLWRMPFWQPYDQLLKSRVADVNHIYNGPFAGSITAALFLKRFVKNTPRFLHMDIYAWTPRAVPARPAGGEPQGARAAFQMLSEIYQP